MALTTKAFLFHYENAQSSDKPRQAKPRVEQHSIAKRIIEDKRIRPMLVKDLTAETIRFALEYCLESGHFQPKIQAPNATK